MTDHDIPDELKDLPDGDIRDAEADMETQRKWFACDGKRYWVDVRYDIPGSKVTELRGRNTTIRRGEEDIDIGGLTNDMLEELISDSSLNEPIEQTIKTCSSEFYEQLNQAVQEVSGGLEGIGPDEGK